MSWIEDLKRVVTINSHTYNKDGVDRVGRVFIEWFEELGYETQIFKRELIGDHLLFKSKKKDNFQTILLLGHLDTVFPKDSFEDFKEDDEWVYGPGVCDMKGGNIVALEALRKTYQEFGKIYNIDILFVSDEETGSDDSKNLSSNLAKEYDICFVFEAAGKNMEVVVGRKGIGTFEIEINGKASHAGTSYQNGIDANLEASIKLQKLVSLTNLQKGSTVNVGKIEGGIGANTISPYSKLLLELRYENSKEKKRLLDALNEITFTSYVNGTKSNLTGSIQRDVMEPESRQDELILAMERISNYHIPKEKRGGVSDANIIASAKTLTIDGLGPYGDGDHTKAERAKKSSFTERIDMMSAIFKYHQKEGKIL